MSESEIRGRILRKHVGWVYMNPGTNLWDLRFTYSADGVTPLPTDKHIVHKNKNSDEVIKLMDEYYGRKVLLEETANLELGLRMYLS